MATKAVRAKVTKAAVKATAKRAPAGRATPPAAAKASAPPPLVDLTSKALAKLPKPREGFESQAPALLAAYDSESELQIKGLDRAAIDEDIAAAASLAPQIAAAQKQLEVLQDTRLLHASRAWASLLKIYSRAQNVGKTNADVAAAVEPFVKFMATGPRAKKAP